MARGSVKPRKNAAGEITSWRVVYDVPAPDGTRKQRVESARTRREAERLLRERLAAIDGGSYVAPSYETVRAFLDRWLAIRDARWRENSRIGRRYEVNELIAPALGDRRLSSLRRIDIETWVAEIGATHRIGTVNLALKTLKAALGDAVTWDVLARNPAAGVAAAGLPAKPRVALTQAEAAKLIAATANDDEGCLWRLMAEGGLRPGEATGMKWADIDFDARELRVRRTIVASNGTWREGPPKTKDSARTVALSDGLVAALREHRRRQVARRVAHPAWTAADFVTERGDGCPLSESAVTGRLTRACAKAGIRRVSPHALRHTMATVAFALGLPAKTVQERLGHSSVKITMDVYTQMVEERRREAADALGDAWEVRDRGDGEKSADIA